VVSLTGLVVSHTGRSAGGGNSLRSRRELAGSADDGPTISNLSYSCGVIPNAASACSLIRAGSRSPVPATSMIFPATSSVIGS
jgi:hypothetical protein